MQLIEHYEVPSGGVSSITFSSIPATFTDLYLMVSIRSTTTGNFSVEIRPNSSTSNLSARGLQGDGSAASSFTVSNIPALATSSSNTANTFSNGSFYIPNYASNSNKSISIDSVTENNATQAFQRLVAGLWSDTTAISSIQLSPAGGDFAQYSSATLYGILAGSDGTTVVS
jgi:hypothetical protein